MNGFSIENIILIISMCIICSLSIRISKLETTINKLLDEFSILKKEFTNSLSTSKEIEAISEEEEHRKKINELFDKIRGSI